MKTILQELIQWSTENSFNIEGQDGVERIVVDSKELHFKLIEVFGQPECQCTHTQACEICASSKGIEWNTDWE